MEEIEQKENIEKINDDTKEKCVKQLRNLMKGKWCVEHIFWIQTFMCSLVWVATRL